MKDTLQLALSQNTASTKAQLARITRRIAGIHKKMETEESGDPEVRGPLQYELDECIKIKNILTHGKE